MDFYAEFAERQICLNSGVIYPYRITFIIDGGSKLGTYLNVSDTTIVMSSGQAGVDEKNFIYDKVK